MKKLWSLKITIFTLYSLLNIFPDSMNTDFNEIIVNDDKRMYFKPPLIGRDSY